MSGLTRDGTAKPVSRNQILRRVRGQGNINFLCSANHEQDWRKVDPYYCYMCDHTYTYIHIYMHSNWSMPSTSCRQSTLTNQLHALHEERCYCILYILVEHFFLYSFVPGIVLYCICNNKYADRPYISSHMLVASGERKGQNFGEKKGETLGQAKTVTTLVL